jgi:DNA invertase Pin-like site-specific DNA recombinase
MSPKRIRRPLDIYVRVSRVGGREGDSFISPELQEEKCRALATARGLAIGEVFTDLDRSGGKMDRPAFKRALERIESGVSGGIIVARVDRFARTLIGGLQAIEAINEAGGVVLTADGEFDTSTATGELVLSIMLSLAQFELRRIRESWKDAQDKAKARGVHVAKPRLGYSREGGRLVENEHLAAVKDVFALRASGGTWGDAVRLLTERGVPTWRGGPWSRQSVRHVVSNPAYREPDGPIPAWQWRKAQTSSSFRAMRGEGYVLGQGLCRCGNCGSGMVRTQSKGDTYLRCPNVGRGHVAIGYEKAEDYILSIAFSHYVGWGLKPREGGDGEDLRKAVDTARAEIAALEEQIGTALPADSRQSLSLEQAEAALAEWQAQEDGPLDWGRVVNAANYRTAIFDKFPMHERRRVLRQMVSEVTVGPGLDENRRRVDIGERISIKFADGTIYGEWDPSSVPIPYPEAKEASSV